jgi:hypothetical protein
MTEPETTQPPGWSNSPPHDGISSTEPPPEEIDMDDPGWSNGDDDVQLPPTVTLLAPATAVLGDPSFTLHVHGTGFVNGSVIVIAAVDEPTTLVSSTEVTTGIDMSVWLGPDPAVPVTVRNPDGAVSNMLPFAFTDPGRA